MEERLQRYRNSSIVYFQQSLFRNRKAKHHSHCQSMNPNRSFNGSSRSNPNFPNNNASFQQSWNNQYQQYPEGYYNQGSNYQGYGSYNSYNYNAYRGAQYYQQPNHYDNKNEAYYHNNSFSYGNMDHNQSFNFGHYQGNSNSFQSHNMNSSVNSENMGLATTGRYGIGANMNKKKKKKEANGSTLQQQVPKVKEPTIKEQSSKEFYFPVKTEVISYAVCPFNAGHLMEPSKLLKHINNCKMNSQNAKHYKVCPYEPTHYFLNSQIEAHILICDMRKHFVVSEDWEPDSDTNNSTVSSLMSILANETIPNQNQQKNVFKAVENAQKKKYEQHLIMP